MSPTAAYDLAPLAAILAVGAALALAPLAWVWTREHHPTSESRLRALTWATLFLTFDLVLFGAFTRLTDSGLGCPDWPGCYAKASPLGAAAHIDAAQLALPTGPVTHSKAWIEMAHRYLATAVGALVTLLAALNWIGARRGHAAAAPRWAALTLLWVCLQGAFGAWTVTMKLYPAIVTLHLLGGIGLLVLLAVQTQIAEPKALALPRPLVRAVWLVALLAVAQIALGGWVSTNYAVLACRDFPTCQGLWWPPMDFAQGFRLRRELGQGADGAYLPFAALTAIHLAHRIGAAILLAAFALLAWRLARSTSAEPRRWGWVLVGIGLWQLATGVGNVVLGWPLAAAVGHTGGAAALALALALLLARARVARRSAPAPRRVAVSAKAAS
ncbi:MAG: COX15/CtaA family protein [Caldimonas sp.]